MCQIYTVSENHTQVVSIRICIRKAALDSDQMTLFENLTEVNQLPSSDAALLIQEALILPGHICDEQFVKMVLQTVYTFRLHNTSL